MTAPARLCDPGHGLLRNLGEATPSGTVCACERSSGICVHWLKGTKSHLSSELQKRSLLSCFVCKAGEGEGAFPVRYLSFQPGWGWVVVTVGRNPVLWCPPLTKLLTNSTRKQTPFLNTNTLSRLQSTFFLR